jgi:hypothetical protein
MAGEKKERKKERKRNEGPRRRKERKSKLKCRKGDAADAIIYQML